MAAVSSPLDGMPFAMGAMRDVAELLALRTFPPSLEIGPVDLRLPPHSVHSPPVRFLSRMNASPLLPLSPRCFHRPSVHGPPDWLTASTGRFSL